MRLECTIHEQGGLKETINNPTIYSRSVQDYNGLHSMNGIRQDYSELNMTEYL